jgi:hypothetical protein
MGFTEQQKDTSNLNLISCMARTTRVAAAVVFVDRPVDEAMTFPPTASCLAAELFCRRQLLVDNRS